MGKHAKTDHKRRAWIAARALCQMSNLMATLSREREAAFDNADADNGFNNTLWPLLRARIDKLNCAALSAVDDEQADLEDCERIVFEEEASHG